MIGRSGFWADLTKAFRACIRAPMLPLLSVLVLLPADTLSLIPRSDIGLIGLTELLLIFAGLFSIGWLGTQRIWFQRIFEGHALTPREVWTLTWRFFPRFTVLGLIVGIPAFAALAWLMTVYIASGVNGTRTAHFVPPPWWIPFWLIYGFVLDVLLTFVTPALAYTTRHVREAFRIGIRLMRTAWPRSATYIFVPPLTLLALAALNPSGLPTPTRDLLGIVSILVALVVKGSIAAFYLRQVPTEPA